MTRRRAGRLRLRPAPAPVALMGRAAAALPGAGRRAGRRGPARGRRARGLGGEWTRRRRRRPRLARYVELTAGRALPRRGRAPRGGADPRHRRIRRRAGGGAGGARGRGAGPAARCARPLLVAGVVASRRSRARRGRAAPPQPPARAGAALARAPGARGRGGAPGARPRRLPGGHGEASRRAARARARKPCSRVQAGPARAGASVRVGLRGRPRTAPGPPARRGWPRARARVFRARTGGGRRPTRMRQDLLERGYWRARRGRAGRARAGTGRGVAAPSWSDGGPAHDAGVPRLGCRRARCSGEIERLLRESGLQADVARAGRGAHRGRAAWRRATATVRVTAREEPRPAGGGAGLRGGARAAPRAWARCGWPATRRCRPGARRWPRGRPSRCDDRMVAADARALQRALEEQGYAEAARGAGGAGGRRRPAGRVPPAAGPAPRGGVRGVRARQRRCPRTRPRASCACRPGGPYRLRDLARDRNTLLAAYRDAGTPRWR